MNPRRPSRAAAGAEAGDTDEDDTTARRPGRRTPTEAKPSKAPWIIGAFLVLGLAAIAAYKPVKRSMLLSELDGASGAAAIDCANRYLEFEKGRESAVRNVIADRRGTFEAQLHLAKTIVSLSCLTALADRGDLEPAQLIQVLDTGVAIYDSEQHRKERLPRETEAWISGDDRDLAIAAIGLLVRHARAGNDADEVTAQLAKIAAEPTVDPLKAKAALDGMGQLLDSDSLGHALGLLRGPAFDQVLGHAALVDAIRNSARAGNLIDLLSLSDHAHEGVRALALDCLGRLTLPDSTDPKLRADLGNRVSAKLTPTTPPVELAAALGAVKNLRLSGASESVIQLARQREALALPGIDDQFWIHCLGDAFILPHGADEANDRLVSRLAECVDDPALLPIAAAAIGRIRDPDLISLRKGLDALARHLDEQVCRESLLTVVDKTFDRKDVITACGDDPQRWIDFLAKDRPRYQRIADIRAYVIANRGTQRISDGRQKLGEVKAYLDQAREELQTWVDDPNFAAPLGLSKKQVEDVFRDVQELNAAVRKAFGGAL